MSDANGKQSSIEVASEAEDVRASLAHTLDQLRENLKPENVVEEVVENARIGASSLADGLYALARENPIPSLLIGAGCALVFGLGARIPSRRRRSVIDARVADEVPSKIAARAGLGDSPPMDVRPSSGSHPAFGGANPKPPSGPPFGLPPTPAQDHIMRSSESLNRSTKKATSRMAAVLHDQPLIIAALGVAVGAAIGAALPGTEVEDEWMGKTSSSVKQAAQDAARSEIDELRIVAVRTADAFKHDAADHGLDADVGPIAATRARG